MSALPSSWRTEPDSQRIGPQYRVRGLDELRVRRCGGYLVKGLIPRPGVTLMYGASGCGKTFLAGLLAACGASGAPFFGRRVQAGAVAYIAAENPASVEQRFAALRDHRGLQAPKLFVVDGPVNLAEVDAFDPLLERLRELALRNGGLVAILVDTAAAAAPGIDENASSDMGRLVRACMTLRDEFGAAVVLVHHAGKNTSQGARGHSSLRAAVDAELEVELLPNGSRRARVTKARDGAIGEELHFTLDVIELGVDDDGDPMTTCRVVELDGQDPRDVRPIAQRLTAQAGIALDALRELTASSMRMSAASSAMPGGKRLVAVAEWRNRFRARRGSPDAVDQDDARREQEASKKAFQRAVDELLKAKLVGVWEGDAWLW